MANTFTLSIMTPEREVLREEAEMIIARGSEGELGILARHIPLVTALLPAPLEVRREGHASFYAVSGGFLEVSGESVTVLAEAVERPDEIDVERAERAKERAEDRLRSRTPELDVLRAELALRRAMMRLDLASRVKPSGVGASRS